MKSLEAVARAHIPFSNTSRKFRMSREVFRVAGAHQILQDQVESLRAVGDRSATLTRQATHTSGRFSRLGEPDVDYEEIMRWEAHYLTKKVSATGIVSRGVKIEGNPSGYVGVSYTDGTSIDRETHQINWRSLTFHDALKELAQIHSGFDNIPLSEQVKLALSLSQPSPDSRRRI